MKRLATLTIVLVLLGFNGDAVLAATNVQIFSDVQNDAWYAPYVEVCYREGLLNGVGGGKFAPNRVVSFAEMYAACARLHSRLTGITVPKIPENGLSGLVYFTDLAGNRIATLDDLSHMRSSKDGLFLLFKEESLENFQYDNAPLEKIQIHLDIYAPFRFQEYAFEYAIYSSVAEGAAPLSEEPIPFGIAGYKLPYIDGASSEGWNVFDDIVMLKFDSFQTRGAWYEDEAWYVRSLEDAARRGEDTKDQSEMNMIVFQKEYPNETGCWDFS